MFLNPVGVLAVGFVALIGNGNHLKGDAAPGFKKAVECGEIGAIVGVTYRFKHFNRYDAVIGALCIAVVAEFNVNLFGKIGFLNALNGEIILRLRDGESRYFAASGAGGFDSKTAPAATDFKNVMVRFYTG